MNITQMSNVDLVSAHLDSWKGTCEFDVDDIRDEMLSRMQSSPIVQAMKNKKIHIMLNDGSKFMDYENNQFCIYSKIDECDYNIDATFQIEQEAIKALLGEE